MYKLEVFYEMTGEFRDDEADGLAGTDHVASGYFFPTHTRDLSYRFKTKEDRDNARFRLSEAGFRFEFEVS